MPILSKNESFSKSVILIYVTRIIGFISGLLSVFLVIPNLASKPEIFGIYTVCISLTIFFSYSDLGFIAAGQKYAAEYFAQKKLDKELEVIGFVIFVLIGFLVLVSFGIAVFAIYPEWIIKDVSFESREISKQLLFILCFSAPIIVFQRFNSIVYSVRLNDYIYQSIDILINVVKIMGISWFVNKESYDIVGYYLFVQLLSFFSAFISIIIATQLYQFSLIDFIGKLRFSSEMFIKTKSLAFSSLLLTISWILYFELDSILLSKFYGTKVVAMYAIGFTILSFCRNMYNTLYAPFQARFNHFVGLEDEVSLMDMLQKVIMATLILCIIPPMVLIFYMEAIIQVWVGKLYLSSVLISDLFVLTIAFSAISIPLSYVLIAKLQNKVLRFSALFLPIIFYLSLWVFHVYLGEKSLAYAKVLTIFLGSCITIWGIYKNVVSGIFSLYFEAIKKMLLPLLLLLICFYLFPAPSDLEFRNFQSYIQLSYRIIPSALIPILIYYFILFKADILLYLRRKNELEIHD